MEKQADLMHPAGYLAMSGGVTDLRLSFSLCHIQSAVLAENVCLCRHQDRQDGWAGLGVSVRNLHRAGYNLS